MDIEAERVRRTTEIARIDEGTVADERIFEHIHHPGLERPRVRNAVPLGFEQKFRGLQHRPAGQRLAGRVNGLESQLEESAISLIKGDHGAAIRIEQSLEDAQPDFAGLYRVDKSFGID